MCDVIEARSLARLESLFAEHGDGAFLACSSHVPEIVAIGRVLEGSGGHSAMLRVWDRFVAVDQLAAIHLDYRWCGIDDWRASPADRRPRPRVAGP